MCIKVEHWFSIFQQSQISLAMRNSMVGTRMDHDWRYFVLLGMDQRHEISVGEKSLLNEITGCVTGAVNSSHHQSIEEIGTDLLIVARAEDPIVEAIQWKDAHARPFFLGVQVRRTELNNPKGSFAVLVVASRTNGRSTQSIFIQYSSSIS